MGYISSFSRCINTKLFVMTGCEFGNIDNVGTSNEMSYGTHIQNPLSEITHRQHCLCHQYQEINFCLVLAYLESDR